MVQVEGLAEVFARHVPASARWREGERSELAVVLAAQLDAIRSAWPTVDLSERAFVAYLAERVDEDRDLISALHTLRVGDLFLACACSRGDEQALNVFDSHFAPQVKRALGRLNLSEAMIDEVHQRLRHKLLVAKPDAPPGLTRYTGRGKLSGYVRVTAVRLALELLKEHKRWTPANDDLLQLNTPCDDDPELNYLRHLYRDEFKVAFGRSMASLTSRERNLLRLQIVDGLSIDEIGALYQVHRSTAARRLARIRQSLALSIRKLMTEQLGIPNDEYESILRLIRSRIDLSMARHLETTRESGAREQDAAKLVER